MMGQCPGQAVLYWAWGREPSLLGLPDSLLMSHEWWVAFCLCLGLGTRIPELGYVGSNPAC